MEQNKIYWFLEQLEFLGGTETATISIANKLSNFYDITLVVCGKKVNSIPYFIDPKIKIIFLNNEYVTKIDEKVLKKWHEKKYFQVIMIFLRLLYFCLFGKYKFRRKVLKRTGQNDILIASSDDNYAIMPKRRHVIFHYHYNAEHYYSFSERLISLFYHKPEYYVFLSKNIRDAIARNKKEILNKSTYIENMIKLKPVLRTEYFNNNFIFLGRYADQKNPLFLIKVAKILKEKGLDFKINFYGSGKLKELMLEKIDEYELTQNVFINFEAKDVSEAFKDKDLLLMSSKFEGMPLVINEANSQSVPAFTTYFGKNTFDAVPDKAGVIINSSDPNDYAEEIIKLVSDRSRFLKYKEEAYKNSLKYSEEVILNNLLNFLKQFQENNKTKYEL